MHVLFSSMFNLCFRNCVIHRIRRIHYFNVTQINFNRKLVMEGSEKGKNEEGKG